jgi:hypothetical protein
VRFDIGSWAVSGRLKTWRRDEPAGFAERLMDNLGAAREGAMTNPARIAILALFVASTASVSAYFMNLFLSLIEGFYLLPRVFLYAPGANLINNLVTSNGVLDPAVRAIYASFREFGVIQSAIFVLLIILSSIFAFIMQNPKSIFSLICSSLFVVVPGIAISKVSAPAYFSYPAPDVPWVLDFQSTVLQMGLSVPFYAALFFVGALLLTEGQPRQPARRNSRLLSRL